MSTLIPIGSVVGFPDEPQKYMIYGRLQKSAKDERVYDYCACPYPQGHVDSDQTVLFDHKSIETLYFIGFQDGEELNFRKLLTEQYGAIKSGQQPDSAEQQPAPPSVAPAPAPSPGDSKYCKNCGNAVSAGAKFCKECGAKQ